MYEMRLNERRVEAVGQFGVVCFWLIPEHADEQRVREVIERVMQQPPTEGHAAVLQVRREV